MASFHAFKVLVIGPYAAGKTSLITQVSNVPVIGTEVKTSGSEAEVKPTTTVGIEYGVFTHADDDFQVDLLLFGTPGQERFAAVREVTMMGMDGLVLLVDGSDPTSWPPARALYAPLEDRGVPVVVAVNRMGPDDPTPPVLMETLGMAAGTPFVHCNAVDPTSVRTVLVAVLARVLDAEMARHDSDAGIPA